MSTYDQQAREQEFEAFDRLPPSVRRVFHEATCDWSAKNCVDYWKSPLNQAFGMTEGRTVNEQIIEDVRQADAEERRKDRALAHAMATGTAWRKRV